MPNMNSIPPQLLQHYPNIWDYIPIHLLTDKVMDAPVPILAAMEAYEQEYNRIKQERDDFYRDVVNLSRELNARQHLPEESPAPSNDKPADISPIDDIYKAIKIALLFGIGVWTGLMLGAAR